MYLAAQASSGAVEYATDSYGTLGRIDTARDIERQK